MDRRGFLAAFIGAAVLDPEKLLWVPGKKLISIPAPREVLRVFVDLPAWPAGPYSFYPGDEATVIKATVTIKRWDLRSS